MSNWTPAVKWFKPLDVELKALGGSPHYSFSLTQNNFLRLGQLGSVVCWAGSWRLETSLFQFFFKTYSVLPGSKTERFNINSCINKTKIESQRKIRLKYPLGSLYLLRFGAPTFRLITPLMWRSVTSFQETVAFQLLTLWEIGRERERVTKQQWKSSKNYLVCKLRAVSKWSNFCHCWWHAWPERLVVQAQM